MCVIMHVCVRVYNYLFILVKINYDFSLYNLLIYQYCMLCIAT